METKFTHALDVQAAKKKGKSSGILISQRENVSLLLIDDFFFLPLERKTIAIAIDWE